MPYKGLPRCSCGWSNWIPIRLYENSASMLCRQCGWVTSTRSARGIRTLKDAMLNRTMPDFRKAILAELKRREWSHYRLIQKLKGKRPNGKDVPPVTVYEFLRGETAINSDDLGLIADALGMKLKP